MDTIEGNRRGGDEKIKDFVFENGVLEGIAAINAQINEEKNTSEKDERLDTLAYDRIFWLHKLFPEKYGGSESPLATEAFGSGYKTTLSHAELEYELDFLSGFKKEIDFMMINSEELSDEEYKKAVEVSAFLEKQIFIVSKKIQDKNRRPKRDDDDDLGMHY